MAETTLADFKLYPEQVQTGMVETLQQETNIFNGASAGAIRLFPQALPAEYAKDAFFQNIAGLVSRRDPTSTSAATDLELTQEENVSVKLNRKIGPVKLTNDAFRKIGSDPAEASLIIGRQSGKAIAVDYVDTALLAAVAAIRNVSALEVDRTTATMDHSALVAGLKTFGDAANRIVAWVMHSNVFHDLMDESIDSKITNVADVAIFTATIGSLRRPVIVTDSPSLIESGSPDTYITLGLVAGGVDVIQSEPSEMVNQLMTGEENIYQRIQGESAYNLKLKGYQWDLANGGTNPADAAVGTGTNWDQVAASVKDTAGFAILTQ